jgi:hypothetical protein
MKHLSHWQPIAICIAAIVVALAVWLEPEWVKTDPVPRAETWNAIERQCLGYVAPTTEIVYVNDPTVAQSVLADGSYRKLGFNAGAEKVGLPLWRQAAGSFAENRAVVFLHGRVGADEHENLVALRLSSEGSGDHFRCLIMNWSVLPPTSAAASSRYANREDGIYTFISPDEPLTLYAGQADPTDDSHFTVRYAVRSGTGLIDARLVAGNQLRFSIRDGPAVETEREWRRRYGDAIR